MSQRFIQKPSKQKQIKYFQDSLWMTIPLIIMSVIFYGMRPLILLVAILVAHLCDRLIAVFRNRQFESSDVSSIYVAAIFTLLLPASVPYRVIVVGVIVAVLIAKEAFGGYEHYIFCPTAVGYCFVGICWPNYVYKYPTPFKEMLPLWKVDASTLVDNPGAVLGTGGLPRLNLKTLLLGDYAGAIGTTVIFVLGACALFLLIRKDFKITAPLSFFLTFMILFFLFPKFSIVSGLPFWQQPIIRLLGVRSELLIGGIVFAAVFLICDPISLPATKKSQAVYGILLGILVFIFRYINEYPEMSVFLALIIMNVCSESISNFMERFDGSSVLKDKEVQVL